MCALITKRNLNGFKKFLFQGTNQQTQALKGIKALKAKVATKKRQKRKKVELSPNSQFTIVNDKIWTH